MNVNDIQVVNVCDADGTRRWSRADIGESPRSRRPWRWNWWVLIAAIMLQECCRDKLLETLIERNVPLTDAGLASLQEQAISELRRLGLDAHGFRVCVWIDTYGEANVDVRMPVDHFGHLWLYGDAT